MITLASLENQTSNRTAGNTQLMRTASNLSLSIEDPNNVPRVPESQKRDGVVPGWLHLVTSEKQPSQAFNQPLTGFFSQCCLNDKNSTFHNK